MSQMWQAIQCDVWQWLKRRDRLSIGREPRDIDGGTLTWWNWFCMLETLMNNVVNDCA